MDNQVQVPVDQQPDLTAPAVEPTSHRCGQCNDEWLTEAEYLAHACPTTGFNPQQAEHLGADFAAVQTAALERGAERAGESQHPADAAEQQVTQ